MEGSKEGAVSSLNEVLVRSTTQHISQLISQRKWLADKGKRILLVNLWGSCFCTQVLDKAMKRNWFGMSGRD